MKYRYREPHEMKDSGVEWLGMIPKEWERKYLKFLIKKIIDNRGRTPQFGDIGIPMLEVKQITQGDKSPSLNFEKFVLADIVKEYERDCVKEGDILISTVGATSGKSVLVDKNPNYFIAQNVIGMRAKNNIHNVFLYYLLSSRYFKDSLESINKSNTIDNLKVSVFMNNFCIVSPKREQEKIATFLDQKTAEFDNIIAKKQAFIDKLAEAKKSLISEVVTGKKKISVNNEKLIVENRKAEDMKDSGVEWLGMIPKEWGRGKLKLLSERTIVGIAEATTQAYRDTGVPIVRATNLKNETILTDDLLYLDEKFANNISSKKLIEGDILTVRTGNAGISAVVPKELDGAHCFTMLITTLSKKANPKYINYILNSVNGQSYFDITAWGTAQKNISVPILQEFILPITNPNNQQVIVDFLDQKTSELDKVIQKIKLQIEKLKEAKQSLISEAVTGKIEVM